jgi:hypothetical protein
MITLGLIIFSFVIVLDTAHSFSPIVLTWWRRDLRKIALAEPTKFMLAPAILFLAGLAGPFKAVSALYWLWNLYHFGMQNYGVMRLLGERRRLVGLALGLGPIAIGMGLMPELIPRGSPYFIWAYLIGLTAFSLDHWLVDLSLASARAPSRPLFIAILAILGAFGFLWSWPAPTHKIGWAAIEGAISIRMGLGFIHFWYSGLIWKRGRALA